jgi:hypothetical protein
MADMPEEPLLPARAALRDFYDERLPLEQMLRALIWHRDWLVVAAKGCLRAVRLGDDLLALAFSDRQALDHFLGKGGAKIRFSDGALADSIESWSHGFYVFHELAEPLGGVLVNALSGAPDGYSLERENFALAQRLARDALLADVLRAGPTDPRFRTVLLRHDEYHVIVPGDPLVSLPGTDGSRAAAVFTSRAVADRFLEQHPRPSGELVMVASMDGAALFPQLREHGYAVVFDPGTAGQVAFDARLPGFVLGDG